MLDRMDPSRVIPMSQPIQPSPTLDGLPKQFVSALRKLFDILDDKALGVVKLTDIEKRWQDDGSKGLPRGVIESLRKVTPPNGLLSFERFCAGLKICLLRNQVETKKRLSGPRMGGEGVGDPIGRPPSAPLLDVEPKVNSWGNNQGNHLPGISNNGRINHSSISQGRTLSMPQLPPADSNVGIPIKPLYGPPKPPRTAAGLERTVDKAEIRSALQSWQMGVMMEEEKRGPGNRLRSVGDGKPSVEPSSPPSQPPQLGPPAGGQFNGQQPPPQMNMQQMQQHKKTNGRRREPRRHTLQNGIDYNMLKRMKQIELEKDVLVQGLEAVDRAREWYLKQIASIQEKMKYLGRMGYSELWSEAQEERLELQRARVLEVNRHLATLTDPGSGLPLHMNLAVNPHSTHMITRLKQQNHLLTQEVNKKNDHISALEREKASMIRELYHLRSQGRPQPPHDPPNFM